MNTPAGWYDDGSGRQRWWDGQQWTEQYATESAEPGVALAAPPMTGGPAAAAPVATKPSALGIIALAVAVVGTVLACIPVTMVAGWILLPIAFVLSVIAFFVKGKKWAPITAISISVVGTIIAIVVAIVTATFALTAYVEEVGLPLPSATAAPSTPSSPATPTPESEAPETDTDTSQRPTGEEVGAGLGKILESSGAGTFDETQLTCLGDALVDSDLDDASLRSIASGQDAAANVQAAELLSTTLASATMTCLMP